MVKFIVDGMLGSLARKLRIYGFDVLYKAEILDERILAIARDEDRIILTSDKGLHNKATLIELKSVLLSEDKEEDRITTVFKSFGLKPDLNLEDSRCPLCNGDIEEIDKNKLNSLPDSIVKRYDRFYSCVKCGKVYWMGSHWLRLKRFSERVMQKL